MNYPHLSPTSDETVDWQGLLSALVPLMGQPCTARIYCGSPPQVLGSVTGTLEYSSDLGPGTSATPLLHLGSQLLVFDHDLFYDATVTQEISPQRGVTATAVAAYFDNGSLIELERSAAAIG